MHPLQDAYKIKSSCMASQLLHAHEMALTTVPPGCLEVHHVHLFPSKRLKYRGMPWEERRKSRAGNMEKTET